MECSNDNELTMKELLNIIMTGASEQTNMSCDALKLQNELIMLQ